MQEIFSLILPVCLYSTDYVRIFQEIVFSGRARSYLCGLLCADASAD